MDGRFTPWMKLASVFYFSLLLVLSILYKPGIAEIAEAFLGSFGALAICYLYATKQDVHFASWAAKSGKAPISRFILLIFAIAWLILSPLLLVG